MFCHSLPVSIRNQRSLNKSKATLSLEFKDRFRKVQTTQEADSPAGFQANLRAYSPAMGLCFAQNILRLATEHLRLMVNSITHLCSHRFPNVLQFSSSSRPVHPPRVTVIKYALKLWNEVSPSTRSSHIYYSMKRGEGLPRILTVLSVEALKKPTRSQILKTECPH